MIMVMLVTLYPVMHITFASLSKPVLVVQHSGLLLYPKGFNFDAYISVFKNPMITLGFSNTLIYVIFGTIVNLILTSLGAYALSRKDLYWKNIIMLIIVFTMFFSGGLIPFYLTVTHLGLLNKRLALIIPSAINTTNLIIMRTSFKTIPDGIEESATMDGANDFTILFRIVLPLSLPVVAVMTLFYSVSHWNSWFNAMIFLRNRALYPLQLILREILILNSTESMVTDISATEKEPVSETIKYATIMVSIVPIMMIYPFLQKYFVKGIMIGALKG
ncbi:MAG: carbohydrate ABC transporter permease [Firmicutes bacterium]|nr:carbohydrate ABC transporter permease [Bacillota bacterium]